MSTMAAIVHIVDDDASFQKALRRLVETYGLCVSCYESGEDFLARLPKSGTGCILLDLEMPGLSGQELQESLVRTVPLLPIVFLTGRGTIAASVQAIKGGAQDFLEKPVSSITLRRAIDHALSENDRRRIVHQENEELQARVAKLTRTQVQVFDLIVRGARNREVALALNKNERTIKAHRQNIMANLGVASVAEMVSIAEKWAELERTRNKSYSFPKGQ